MSSSYSSLDWVLSHWAHFTVRRFICVIYVYFMCFGFILHSCCIIVSVVGWTWWDWSLILRTHLPSVLRHCWLGHLTRKNPSPIWPMCLVATTLNLAPSNAILKILVSKMTYCLSCGTLYPILLGYSLPFFSYKDFYRAAWNADAV